MREEAQGRLGVQVMGRKAPEQEDTKEVRPAGDVTRATPETGTGAKPEPVSLPLAVKHSMSWVARQSDIRGNEREGEEPTCQSVFL